MSEGAGTLKLGSSPLASETETVILPPGARGAGAVSTADESLSRPTAASTVQDAYRASGSTHPLGGTKKRKTGVIVAVAVIAVLIPGFAYYYNSRKNSAAVESLAVLPFVKRQPRP